MKQVLATLVLVILASCSAPAPEAAAPAADTTVVTGTIPEVVVEVPAADTVVVDTAK